MQLHVHYVNLMKKKITWKFQSLEILKQTTDFLIN
jgi:hypothetical protein